MEVVFQGTTIMLLVSLPCHVITGRDTIPLNVTVHDCGELAEKHRNNCITSCDIYVSSKSDIDISLGFTV